ncbi:ABC transporter G member 7 [Asimina triloba]
MELGHGGKRVGQMLMAVAAAFLLRLLSGPGPAKLPEIEPDYDEAADESAEKSDVDEAQATGKVFPVTIRWADITCSLLDKSGKTQLPGFGSVLGVGSAEIVVQLRDTSLCSFQFLYCSFEGDRADHEAVRFLLSNVNGEAKPGRLLAIMGPSGSGKTTLLNVLAGQVASSPRLRLTGHLEVNGRPKPSRVYKVAYVRQEDLFFSQLTVRETLSLASELQLSETLSAEERDEYVNNLLFRFGLVSCADSNVGDAKVRGISGGEKKRLSLACELIASPSVIFADEPTTGLDAFQAERVMETLQQLAQDGHTVICSIHQPRSSVYAKFNDIVLLSEGAVVYMGPAQEALAYFAKLGLFSELQSNAL